MRNGPLRPAVVFVTKVGRTSITAIRPSVGLPATRSNPRKSRSTSCRAPSAPSGPTRTACDLAGNVWEWSDTCFARIEVGDGGKQVVKTMNCGVRVVEGRHRTYVTDFIRDARAGG